MMSSPIRDTSALANRRMTLGLLFSLVVHALILSLQFGLPGAGLPSLEMPFKKQRAAPGSLTVQLTQSAAAPASQQSPQDTPSQLQQTATSPASAAQTAPAPVLDHAVSAAPTPTSPAQPAALSWVKLAPAKSTPAPAKSTAKKPAKAKPAAALASARQKKVLAPETQRLLTQNGWNEDGFVVAANPPNELKPESEDLRKHYDDIQQEGVEDPDERSKRLHDIEQKRQQKHALAQQKAQQQVQEQVQQTVAETELAKLEQQLQQQMQVQSQQIEAQAKQQAEQAAEQRKMAEAEQVRQQQREQQQREQQALALAQQQRAEAERQQQEQLAEQQQRQERQSLIAQRQAEQAQQRQFREAQKARQLSELKPDVNQQMQQVQQANQQALQKLEQQVQEDEQHRVASEARERAVNAQASQLAQQKAAQQRADSHHDKLNSQLRQGASSELQSIANQLAQAPVAIAAAKPASTSGIAQGSDPLASARAINEGGSKQTGNAERGNSVGTGLNANANGLSRPAAADLTGSVRDQLKQLDRSRSSPLAQSDEGEKRRRRSILGEQERDVPLRMYIESWKHKVERNANLNYSQLAKDRARGDPLVTVAIRSDGSVEEIIINRSSGRADLDEAVRRIVKINAKYAAFPPNVAAVYDVIEIRKVWLFEEVLRVVDDIR